MAAVLEADVDELSLLAKTIPEDTKGRVLECTDVFRKVARLDDEAMDAFLSQAEHDTTSLPPRADEE